MTNTYEMIKAIPAKGFDWTGFNAALRAEYVALVGRNIGAWCVQHVLTEWDAAKGVRQMRSAAMEMACSIVSRKATRVNIIAPSQESAMWDSFEGGHHFAGKVWMIHSFTKAKQRVNPDEVAKYKAEGWVKGGPRSK